MQSQSELRSANDQHVLGALNSFLRGEISAVETYRQALPLLNKTPHAGTVLECMRSHESRVHLLKEQIRSLGGKPSDGSGVWGSFAKLVEGTAAAVGEKAAIYALEEGEDHGRNDYQRDIDKLDETTKQFVQKRLLAEQLRTHDMISAIKKSL